MNSDYEELRSVLSGYGLIKDNEQINAALIDRVAKIISKEYRLTKRLAEDEGPISLGAFVGSTTSPPVSQELAKEKEAGKESQVSAIEAAKKAALATFEAQNRPIEPDGESEGGVDDDQSTEASAPVAKVPSTQGRSPQQTHFAGILKRTIPKNLPPTIGAASGGADGADGGEESGEDVDVVEGEGDNPAVPAGLRGLFTDGLPPRQTLDQIESRTAGKNRTISRRS